MSSTVAFSLAIDTIWKNVNVVELALMWEDMYDDCPCEQRDWPCSFQRHLPLQQDGGCKRSSSQFVPFESNKEA